MNTTCTSAVYLYQVTCGTVPGAVSGNAVIVQTLKPVVVSGQVNSVKNTKFGLSVAMNNNFLLAGAPSASKLTV